jgi:hypothetical protein
MVTLVIQSKAMLISIFDIAVSASTLLKEADFILFLNKCDLLKRKLEAGVRIKDYISRFQGDDQTVEGVTQCKLCCRILYDREERN